MNIDERIKQCEKDIEILEEEKAKLEKKKEANYKVGDIFKKGNTIVVCLKRKNKWISLYGTCENCLAPEDLVEIGYIKVGNLYEIINASY